MIEGGQYAAPPGGAFLRRHRRLQRHLPRHGHLLEIRPRKRAASTRTRPALELPPPTGRIYAIRASCERWLVLQQLQHRACHRRHRRGGRRCPFEAGASQHDMDYLHVINLNKAAEVAARNENRLNGFNYVPCRR
ncbi:MAG: hypothetical protein R2856_19165 [Caldilineaceae bacterium]